MINMLPDHRDVSDIDPKIISHFQETRRSPPISSEKKMRVLSFEEKINRQKSRLRHSGDSMTSPMDQTLELNRMRKRLYFAEKIVDELMSPGRFAKKRKTSTTATDDGSTATAVVHAVERYHRMTTRSMHHHQKFSHGNIFAESISKQSTVHSMENPIKTSGASMGATGRSRRAMRLKKK
jgi:hypothetical protein